MSDEEAMVVQTADPVERKLAENLLAEAGIPYRVEELSAAAYLSAFLGSGVGGPAGVFVPVEFEEKALAILAEAWGEPEETDDGDLQV